MKCLFLIHLLFLSVALYAQSTDNYDISLEGHWVADDNSVATYQSHSLRAKLLSQVLNQGKNGIFNIYGTYDYVDIKFKDNQELLDNLEHFHSVGLMLGYSKQLRNQKWSFTGMVIPQLNSNFTNGIKGDDLYLNILALFNYSKRINIRLSMGLAYTNTLGFPAPIPVINYWKAWNDQWEMNLGFPRISLTHHFNSKTSLIVYSELKGYNGNISKNINNSIFKENGTAQRISYRDILAGLECRYKLKRIQLKINASYTINRDFKLQNTNNNTVYKFDMNSSFDVGVGIAFNL